MASRSVVLLRDDTAKNDDNESNEYGMAEAEKRFSGGNSVTTLPTGMSLTHISSALLERVQQAECKRGVASDDGRDSGGTAFTKALQGPLLMDLRHIEDFVTHPTDMKRVREISLSVSSPLREPLILAYDARTHDAWLSEGHHRLSKLKQMDVKVAPVIVISCRVPRSVHFFSGIKRITPIDLSYVSPTLYCCTLPSLLYLQYTVLTIINTVNTNCPMRLLRFVHMHFLRNKTMTMCCFHRWQSKNGIE